MTKGVRRDMFVNFCEAGGFFDGFLHGGFVDVVAADLTPGPSPGRRGESVRVFG